MPEGRFLSRSIATSEQLARVSLEADYLFTRCIPHLDVDGRMPGNPKTVKGITCPLRDAMTPEVIERSLRELADAELVVWYEVDGRQLLEFPAFRAHQKGLKADREAKSKLPSSRTARARRVSSTQDINTDTDSNTKAPDWRDSTHSADDDESAPEHAEVGHDVNASDTTDNAVAPEEGRINSGPTIDKLPPRARDEVEVSRDELSRDEVSGGKCETAVDQPPELATGRERFLDAITSASKRRSFRHEIENWSQGLNMPQPAPTEAEVDQGLSDYLLDIPPEHRDFSPVHVRSYVSRLVRKRGQPDERGPPNGRAYQREPRTISERIMAKAKAAGMLDDPPETETT